MNSFAKKILGAAVLLATVACVWSAPTSLNLGRLPLWFEAVPSGAGQADQYLARGRDSQILISRNDVQFSLRDPARQIDSARMEFVGAATAATVSGLQPLSGKINFITGNDSAKWRAGLTAYSQVQVQNIYPGIDIRYYGNQQRLEYDFDLQPQARPEAIALRFAGVDSVAVGAGGELVVKLAGRDIIQQQPVAYQLVNGQRQPVNVGYRMIDAHTAAFAVGHYNPNLPLVIDPVMSYSTFFGGNSLDIPWAVVYATNDNSVYIAGQTMSTAISSSLPFATPGAFQTNFAGGKSWGDAFVAKFHDPGTNVDVLTNLSSMLAYCTYLGGTSDDIAYTLAVDSTGHAFVGGITISLDFPHTNSIIFVEPNGHIFNGATNQGSFQTILNGYASDGFVSELDTNGSSLIFSSYLGGNQYDAVMGLSLDSQDNIFVTGYTFSTNYPVTANAFQPQFQSVYGIVLGYNAFVSEISTNATNGFTLSYSSYLGGTNEDVGRSISYNNGFLAVVGNTCSSNFPTTNYINQIFTGTNVYRGNLLNSSTNNYNNNLVSAPYVNDIFVTLFQGNGSGLNPAPVYSTLLGGTNNDVANGAVVDAAGSVYVVGATVSTNFPTTANPGQVVLPSYLLTNNLGYFYSNSFLTKITWTPGTNAYVAYSQVFGGVGHSFATGVSLDQAGDIFIAGADAAPTNYVSFYTPAVSPLIPSLYVTNSGGYDAYVTAIKGDLSGILYSADFGSWDNDYAYSIATDPEGNAYVTGQTFWNPGGNIPFPTVNAWEPNPPDANNGFLTKIWLNSPALPQLAMTRTGTNLFLNWSSVPLTEINTNTLYVTTVTNLLSPLVLTNIVIDTNALPYVTNKTVVTNMIPATNWVRFAVTPVSSNVVVNGVTNQFYTYPVKTVYPHQFFQLSPY